MVPAVSVRRFAFLLALTSLSSAVAFAPTACNTASLKDAPGTAGPDGSVTRPDDPDDADPELDGGRETGDLDGALLPATRNVRFVLQPSDNGAALVAAIRGAKTSVHATLYLLTGNTYVDAFIAAKQAGRDVKIILNQKFPTGGNSNTTAYNRLRSAGVDVVWAPAAFDFTHAKVVSIDAAEAWIMTMNLTQTSASDNREVLAVDGDTQDVADVETIFEGDYTGRAVHVAGKLVVSPSSTTPVTPRARLVALVDSARTSVDVLGQTLSDSAVTEALVRAKTAGLRVRVVLDAATLPGTPAQDQAVASLKAAGIEVRAARSPDIHAKAIVVDGARAFVGSQNFTPTALFDNREVGLVTDNATAVTALSRVVDDDHARASAL